MLHSIWTVKCLICFLILWRIINMIKLWISGFPRLRVEWFKRNDGMFDKKATGRDWTVDLSICNRMLYHWATVALVPPFLEFYLNCQLGYFLQNVFQGRIVFDSLGEDRPFAWWNDSFHTAGTADTTDCGYCLGCCLYLCGYVELLCGCDVIVSKMPRIYPTMLMRICSFNVVLYLSWLCFPNSLCYFW